LDALALRCRDFLSQRCFQFPDLPFGTLAVRIPPKPAATANHIVRLSASQKNTSNPSIQSATEAVLDDPSASSPDPIREGADEMLVGTKPAV
jgi:hypothetical protein